jgi:hypothetical protein
MIALLLLSYLAKMWLKLANGVAIALANSGTPSAKP